MRTVIRSLLVTAGLAAFASSAIAQDRVESMISPAFHPVTFEDPRNLSELRFIYAYHEIDDEFVTEGGDVQIYALQARFKLTDELSFIATKDGYVDFNPNATLPKKSGWADVAAGLKYTFFQDDAAGQVASFQLRYTLPTGNGRVFQGNGDGDLHPSVSAAFALSDEVTLMAGTGLRIPMDNDYSMFWDADAQIDYRIDTDAGSFYPLAGISLVHVVDDGNQLPIADEGQDFFNFGASDAAGESIVLGALGLRYRPIQNVDIGAAYQAPFNDGKGSRIVDYRWTFDVIYRF